MDNIVSKEKFLAGDYTSNDLFPDKKKDNLKELKSLLDSPSDLSVEEFPVPTGVSNDLQQAMKEDQVDSKIYQYNELAKIVKALPDEPKITSGFDSLNEALDGGFQGGELVILSAATKNGKTTFCQTMSYLQAVKGVNSLWFSLEMSWQEITRKFLAMDIDDVITQVPANLGIFYMIDNRGLNLKTLEIKAKEARDKLGVKIIYIDHLHFLLPLGETKNVSFVIGGIVREVKQIAVKLNITIVLIAHTKKLETDARPDINSLRDSSFIAQESDFVFLMWRERLDLDKKQKKYTGLEEEDIYSEATFVALEANRRNGKTKRWKFGLVNDCFHEYGTYLYIKNENGTEVANIEKKDTSQEDTKKEIKKNTQMGMFRKK